jgi:hypothetical protein
MADAAQDQAVKNIPLFLLPCSGNTECPWDVVNCAEAAYGGHRGVLQWARPNGCPREWDYRPHLFIRVAAGGHLTLLQCVEDGYRVPLWGQR